MKTKQKEQIIKNALLAYERELKRDLKINFTKIF